MATSKNSPTPGETSDAAGPAGGLLDIAPVTVSATAVDPATTDDEGKPLVTSAELEKTHLKDIGGVYYTGYADVKTLTVEDFARVGVEAKGDLTWSSENEHFVPKSDLNAATLEFLLSDPADFRAE